MINPSSEVHDRYNKRDSFLTAVHDSTGTDLPLKEGRGEFIRLNNIHVRLHVNLKSPKPKRSSHIPTIIPILCHFFFFSEYN